MNIENWQRAYLVEQGYVVILNDGTEHLFQTVTEPGVDTVAYPAKCFELGIPPSQLTDQEGQLVQYRRSLVPSIGQRPGTPYRRGITPNSATRSTRTITLNDDIKWIQAFRLKGENTAYAVQTDSGVWLQLYQATGQLGFRNTLEAGTDLISPFNSGHSQSEERLYEKHGVIPPNSVNWTRRLTNQARLDKVIERDWRKAIIEGDRATVILNSGEILSTSNADALERLRAREPFLLGSLGKAEDIQDIYERGRIWDRIHNSVGEICSSTELFDTTQAELASSTVEIAAQAAIQAVDAEIQAELDALAATMEEIRTAVLSILEAPDSSLQPIDWKCAFRFNDMRGWLVNTDETWLVLREDEADRGYINGDLYHGDPIREGVAGHGTYLHQSTEIPPIDEIDFGELFHSKSTGHYPISMNAATRSAQQWITEQLGTNTAGETDMGYRGLRLGEPQPQGVEYYSSDGLWRRQPTGQAVDWGNISAYRCPEGAAPSINTSYRYTDAVYDGNAWFVRSGDEPTWRRHKQVFASDAYVGTRLALQGSAFAQGTLHPYGACQLPAVAAAANEDLYVFDRYATHEEAVLLEQALEIGAESTYTIYSNGSLVEATEQDQGEVEMSSDDTESVSFMSAFFEQGKESFLTYAPAGAGVAVVDAGVTKLANLVETELKSPELAAVMRSELGRNFLTMLLPLLAVAAVKSELPGAQMIDPIVPILKPMVDLSMGKNAQILVQKVLLPTVLEMVDTFKNFDSLITPIKTAEIAPETAKAEKSQVRAYEAAKIPTQVG